MKISLANNFIKNHKMLLGGTVVTGLATTGYVYNVRKTEQDTYSKRSPKAADPLIPELKVNSKDLTLHTEKHGEFKAIDVNPNNSDKYIIYCNGMHSSIKNHQQVYVNLMSSGCGVIGFDYPGTGISSGEFSKSATKESTESVYNYLLQKGIKPENIGVIGHSMGCAVASGLAAEHTTAFTVLLCPFNTARDEIKYFIANKDFPKSTKSIVKHIPSSLIPIKYKFNNEKNLNNINSPLLIIGAIDDNVVPVDLARKLSKKHQSKPNLTYIEVQSGGHKADDTKLGLCMDFIGKNFKS